MAWAVELSATGCVGVAFAAAGGVEYAKGVPCVEIGVDMVSTRQTDDDGDRSEFESRP